ncbi:Hypothetical predicted protein [Xyrichtys novacula]|uniref:Uncharacterized protein n=1 Tax=Xyrichtys novacula TaxID=13765 RepID=A0AAV1H4B0_XYRNO|nr:Hypothetical predicted protein [Xyrichtys novacula]
MNHTKQKKHFEMMVVGAAGAKRKKKKKKKAFSGHRPLENILEYCAHKNLQDAHILQLRASSVGFQPAAEESVHCEHIWTGTQPGLGRVVGWLHVEDVGWSLEPGGCSFINQVGTVKGKHRHLPASTLKDHIVLLLWKEVWVLNVFCYSLRVFFFCVCQHVANKSNPRNAGVFMQLGHKLKGEVDLDGTIMRRHCFSVRLTHGC